MIQIVASVLVILFSFGAVCLIAHASKKPYDGFDIWGGVFFVLLILAGLGRLVWIAFS